MLDNRGWMHSYDDEGKRRIATTSRNPWRISDDPFRSLAGELRLQGGYAKDTTNFSEFLWADFLRHRIERKAVEKNFDETLKQAALLAKSEAANYVAGWCGPVSRSEG